MKFLLFMAVCVVVWFTVIEHDQWGREKLGFGLISMVPAHFQKLFPIDYKIVELVGPVADCTCEFHSVHLCMDHLHSLISSLSNVTFFKFFKVNYLKDCPLWEDDVLCSIDGEGSCGVSPCETEDVPPHIHKQHEEDCQQRRRGKVKENLHEKEREWIDRDEKLWINQDDNDHLISYVDLHLNPEKYTGYGSTSGQDSAARIWKAIYLENCFSENGDESDQCFEERVFYRLISGFHASTTAHICENFVVSEGLTQPNLDFFSWKLGMWPDRLKNIYFTYLFLIRATHSVRETLLNYDYGPDKALILPLLEEMYSSELVCSSPFDESSMFQDPNTEHLKGALRSKFRNISSIMDCVTCETCKIHAKLQILGIGTALRVLLDEDENVPPELEPNEVIALVNSLLKFSESIQIYHHMAEREQTKIVRSLRILVVAMSFILFIVCQAVFALFKRNPSATETSNSNSKNPSRKPKSQ